MKKINKEGFTLIELLVVVLIIGILAAVALPQYKKAVFKSKLAQLDVAVDAAKKSVQLYLTAHGWPTGEDAVTLTGEIGVSEIEIPGIVHDNYNEISSDINFFQVVCDAEKCSIHVSFYNDYDLLLILSQNMGNFWYVDRHIYFEGYKAKVLCQYLKERNYPADGGAFDFCAAQGVTLETID